jgi:hypothetical protein
MDRSEYIEKLKQQLDEWDTKLADWEAQMQKAQSSVRAQYLGQLERFHKQREDMMKRLTELQRSSQSAWLEMSKGADEAWNAMSSSFERAWGELRNPKKPEKP